MKKLVLLFCLVGFMGCTNDDAPDFDPVAQLEADLEAIEAHLTDNNLQAEQDDVTGLYFNITRPGSGDNPTPGDIVTLNYKLYNFDGELLDTNLEQAARDADIFVENRPYVPFEVTMGTGQVIVGFERALSLLVVDSEGIFYIPSVLAYANAGSGPIAPNQSIIFEIELLTVD